MCHVETFLTIENVLDDFLSILDPGLRGHIFLIKFFGTWRPENVRLKLTIDSLLWNGGTRGDSPDKWVGVLDSTFRVWNSNPTHLLGPTKSSRSRWHLLGLLGSECACVPSQTSYHVPLKKTKIIIRKEMHWCALNFIFGMKSLLETRDVGLPYSRWAFLHNSYPRIFLLN